MSLQEQAIHLIRQKGPVIPSNISKELGQNILMTSAILSEMVSNKTLRISSTKIGGSPLYYLAEQESRLQDFSSNLQEKDNRAYERIRMQKVIRDSEQEPLMRVSLRAIKDFVRPLNVTVENEKILFWKWYLTSPEEAEKLIREKLGVVVAEPIDSKPVQEPKKEDKISPAKAEPIKEEPKKEKSPEPRKFEKPSPKHKEIQRTIAPKPEETSKFIDEIMEYFSRNNIKVIEQSIIRRSSELDFIISIPTTVGNLQYFCKAKSKKKVNDGDLSSVFIQAQSKRLPALFLGKGGLTKKAEAVLASEFKGMFYKKV